MKDKLTFYIERDSPVHRLNPLTKILIVLSLILLAFLGPGYWLSTALFLFIIIPLSFLGHIQKEFLGTTIRLLIPGISFLFVMQAFFHPGGEEHILFQFWFLEVTVESLQFAYLTSSRIMVMVSSFIILLLTTHPSSLMSDLTRRGLSGTFAYVITSTLQILPLMRAKASTIIDAQRSRGLNTEGSYKKRFSALLPLVGPLVFGSLVDVEERAIAIEARGFTSKKEKTSLHDIPDTTLDKVIRWSCVVIVILVIGSKLWLS